MSTLDDFQKRITKLEVEVADLRQTVLALVFAKKQEEKPTLPEARDYVESMPEERIAEEAVREATIEKPEE
jgi:hypothetical protein